MTVFGGKAHQRHVHGGGVDTQRRQRQPHDRLVAAELELQRRGADRLPRRAGPLHEAQRVAVLNDHGEVGQHAIHGVGLVLAAFGHGHQCVGLGDGGVRVEGVQRAARFGVEVEVQIAVQIHVQPVPVDGQPLIVPGGVERLGGAAGAGAVGEEGDALVHTQQVAHLAGGAECVLPEAIGLAGAVLVPVEIGRGRGAVEVDRPQRVDVGHVVLVYGDDVGVVAPLIGERLQVRPRRGVGDEIADHGAFRERPPGVVVRGSDRFTPGDGRLGRAEVRRERTRRRQHGVVD